jgi:uncharacterized membrane-anchored protein
MQPLHLPTLGARYWSALCLASIVGANMGDFFARDFVSGRNMLGLPLSTAVTEILFVALPVVWKQSARLEEGAVAVNP